MYLGSTKPIPIASMASFKADHLSSKRPYAVQAESGIAQFHQVIAAPDFFVGYNHRAPSNPLSALNYACKEHYP